MTNLAQPVTSLTNNHRPALRGEPPALQAQVATAQPATPATAESAPGGNLLVLSGGAPQTVNVFAIAGVPMFWQQGSPQQLYSGITWPTGGYALMLTFAFVSPPDLSSAQSITQLVPTMPSLWFSDTFSASGVPSQMCCVPSILGEFDFDVLISEATGATTRHKTVDPKIVVTPIVT